MANLNTAWATGLFFTQSSSIFLQFLLKMLWHAFAIDCFMPALSFCQNRNFLSERCLYVGRYRNFFVFCYISDNPRHFTLFTLLLKRDWFACLNHALLLTKRHLKIKGDAQTFLLHSHFVSNKLTSSQLVFFLPIVFVTVAIPATVAKGFIWCSVSYDFLSVYLRHHIASVSSFLLSMNELCLLDHMCLILVEFCLCIPPYSSCHSFS